MTDVTASAEGGDRGALAADARGGNWMTRFVLALAVLVATLVAIDMGMDETFGWDARVNCAAVDAHVQGLDSYYVKNLKDTKLSYPYLPVTLDAFRPACAGGFLVAHYKPIYLVLALISALLLPGLGKSRPGLREVALRSLFALGGFLGFEWIIATGNFAILSGLLTAASLALLLRPVQSGRDGSTSLAPQLAGAALLGLVTSFKLVFFPVLAALYFLPQPRARKLVLIAVAAGMFVLPILASLLIYPDLFKSWLSAIFGQIPGQHSPGNEVNPSLLFLALSLADRIGLAGSKPVVAALYGLIAIALVLAPFAISVWRMIGASRPTRKTSLLQMLDDWLVDHPDAAMRITVLAMYALYLCAPRLKEYAFFEVALYAAILVVDLPAALMAAVLTVAIAIPTLASVSGVFMDGFSQLAIALICFWLLLPRGSSGSPASWRGPQQV
ncbi:glycosyltransferase 87 family protein [Bradyrhizobium sp. AT1]|uniref:glycosyltransferase 87 family protein n=1 Tax=Bradyrhizobium sp. AT1 TaxID=574934 RepID=UPI0007ABF07A|nr:glycosyltransferase 87 family protein [Bradyrhizobium sp. AT1]